MKVLIAVLCALCLAGCSTVQEWSSYVEQKVKEKVLIVEGGPYEIKVLKYNAKTEQWEEAAFDMPDGYYVLPPLPEILGIK